MTIKNYHKENAKDLGVKVSLSDAKGKKLKVELPDGKIRHIGAKGYMDYKKYEEKDKELANEKRKNYRARHKCDNAVKYSNRHLACEILWADRKKGILRGK